MPRFECLNEECSEYQKEVFFTKINYRFDKTKGELVASEDLKCKECGVELTLKKKEGYPQLMKFNSLSEGEKRKVIHNRAQTHFDKVGKEQKLHIKKNVLKRQIENGNH
jgi:hypothetical protein